MRIVLSGGGTAGSVMPLLAVYEEIKKRNIKSEFLFIGTKSGEPEKRILQGKQIKFRSIYGGKIRRYFDIKNIIDIFYTFIGFLQTLAILFAFKPDVIMGAGGYISVPVIWAGWVLRAKIIIHQQDIKPSLSNILCVNLAHLITVTFKKSLSSFPRSKTIWTGNPVRSDIFQGDLNKAKEIFQLNDHQPVLLVMGGGTGAMNLNTLVNQALPELLDICQVIHITGRGKRVSGTDRSNYHQYEFLTSEYIHALRCSNIVVSRAGLSALTEFVSLKKPVVLVPLRNSHQEINAQYFAEKNAAVVIEQDNLSPKILVAKIKELLADENSLAILSDNIAGMMKVNAQSIIVDQIIRLTSK